MENLFIPIDAPELTIKDQIISEFSPTRQFIAHTSAEKKAAQEAAKTPTSAGKPKTGSKK